SEKLVREVVESLDTAVIERPSVTITKALVEVGADDSFEALQMTSAKTLISLSGRYPVPNIVALVADLLGRTSRPVRLTRATILDIFRRTAQRGAAVDNPHEFAARAARIIKE